MDNKQSQHLKCAECGYDLYGISTHQHCPECGTSVEATIVAQQQRPSRSRKLIAVIVFAFIAGIITKFLKSWLDDVPSFSTVMEAMPWLPYISSMLFAVAALLVLAIIATHVRGGRVGTAIFAVAIICVAEIAAMYIFNHSPLRNAIGMIRSGDSDLTRMENAFFMRLYFCGASLAFVSVCSLLLSPRRTIVLCIIAGWCIGLLCAVLHAFSRAAGTPMMPMPWTYWMHWPDLLASGLRMTLIVLMAVTLAWAITERRNSAQSPGSRR
jgi:hypothetical protein